MLGVSRDKWSLFWDAYVAPTSELGTAIDEEQEGMVLPAQGGGGGGGGRGSSIDPPSILQGFRQEAITLANFLLEIKLGVPMISLPSNCTVILR